MNFKKKFLNFRYLPFMLLVAIAGILLISLLDFVYAIVVGALFLLSIILTFCVKKWKVFRIRMIILFVTFVIFALVGGEWASNAKQFRMPIDQTIITGVINSDSDMKGERAENSDYILYNLVLTDCSYYENDKNNDLDGKIGTYIYLHNDIKFSVGDIISLKADAIPKTIKLTQSVNVYNYVEGIRWTLDKPVCVGIYAGKPSLTESIKIKAKEAMIKYVPSGEIMYSMVFGDTKAMLSSFNWASKATGLSHLFAVSGLHLGIVSGVVGFLCKKSKANKLVDYLVVLLLSGLYALLVGFGPSVARAFLMLTIFKTGNLFGVRHCAISSLSLSAMIILIINPLTLFNLSFQLSIMAIVGVIFFEKTLSKLFKIKWKALRTFVSLNLSVNIALLPIMLHYFGKVSLIFLFSNLLIVPFAVLIFPLIFLVVLLSAAYAPIAYILLPFGYVFSFLSLMIINLAKLPFLSINFSLNFFWIAVYILLMVLLSTFSMISKKPKRILAIVLSVFIVANVILTSFGRIDGSTKLEMVTSKNDTDIVMLDVGNKHYLIVNGELSVYSLGACSSYLAEKNIAKIDGLVKSSFSDSEISVLNKYKTKLNIACLITNTITPVLQYVFDDKVFLTKVVGEYTIAPINENVVWLNSDLSNIVFASNIEYGNQVNIPHKVDILYCTGNFDIAYVAKPKYFVNNNAVINNIPQSVNSYFTFIIKGDKIKVV